MKSFKDVLVEEQQKEKKAVMAFGRMNPPTTGHLKLIDKVRHIADKEGASHHVVVSHSQDAKKNPLSADQKVQHLKKYSPGTKFHAASSEHPTIMHHAAELHRQGHTHLTVVAGSDRVKEMHDLLHKYNGKTGKHGHYNFKHIEVRSAGHRDPDSEGAEGMSGTKMRQHAQNNDFHSFRQGVPSHVKDEHAKSLFKDVRKGMGLHEDYGRGYGKAIFITGGPGSGKDVVVREAIAEQNAVELNSIQAHKILFEGVTAHGKDAIARHRPLIINGPADDPNLLSIKENLEDRGYTTMMIFVDSSDSASKQRNERLSRMMVESVRHEKWTKAQKNKDLFGENFEIFLHIDNSGSVDMLEESITVAYQLTNGFFDLKFVNENIELWQKSKSNIFLEAQQQPVLKKNIDVSDAKGPDDVSPDNRMDYPQADNPKFDGPKRTKTYTFKTYSEATATLVVTGQDKTPNFQKDKETEKAKKMKYQQAGGRITDPTGYGQEVNTRAAGTSYSAGAGIGDATYREDTNYSNDDVANFAALNKGPEPNPLATPKPEFKKKKISMESIDDPGGNDMGVGGTLCGASNKEPLETPADKYRLSGMQIKEPKKRKKFGE